jgi:hypothetical protein
MASKLIPLRLTEEQIADVTEALHERVQFYNANGAQDNRGVLRKVEAALMDAFGPTIRGRGEDRAE